MTAGSRWPSDATAIAVRIGSARVAAAAAALPCVTIAADAGLVGRLFPREGEAALTPTLHTLAWKCWLAEGGGVPLPDAAERVELEPSLRDGTLIEDDNGIRFADANVMVRGAARNVLAAEDASLVSSPKVCFNRLDEIWAKEIGKEDTVSGHVLSALHNSRRIDAFAWARQAVEAGVRISDAVHVMEGSLPHFAHADAASILRFFAVGSEAEKSAIFGGMLYPKFERWLPGHLEVAREIKRLHETRPEDHSYALYGAALHALIHSDFQSGFNLAIEAMREDMKGLRSESPIKDHLMTSAAQAGLPFLDFIGCRHFRTPVDPVFWQRLASILTPSAASPSPDIGTTDAPSDNRLGKLSGEDAASVGDGKPGRTKP